MDNLQTLLLGVLGFAAIYLLLMVLWNRNAIRQVLETPTTTGDPITARMLYGHMAVDALLLGMAVLFFDPLRKFLDAFWGLTGFGSIATALVIVVAGYLVTRFAIHRAVPPLGRAAIALQLAIMQPRDKS